MSRVFSNPPKHAVVIGGSMTGLLTARVLSNHFDKVTIIERDPVHDSPESRKGQPQTRHLHGLLAQGLLIIQELFPGIQDELVQGGAITGDMGDFMHWYAFGGYRIAFKSNLTGMCMSRPFLEFHIRRRVLNLPNVTLLDSCAVSELVTTPDKKQVTGVRLNQRSADNTTDVLNADLVVDASGRGSSAAKWLETLGYARPSESRVKARLGYVTREYRRTITDPDTLRIQMVTPAAPVERHGVFLFPIEGDRWIMTASGYVDDHPPATEAGLLEFLRNLPAKDAYNIISQSEPLTDIITYNYPASLRRHYEKLTSFPAGYLVIGDAIASFNPIYGQGMTSAAMQARALDESLRERVELKDLWKSFFKKAGKVVDIPWQLAVGEDFRFPQTEGAKPPMMDFLNAYVAKVHQATHRDSVVYAAFLRVMNLMAPPTSLMSPGIFGRVLRNS